MRQLAEGPGWKVSDIVCKAGPDDVPFEEAHEWVSISAVVSGTFVYRSTYGRRLMAPGSLLLGNQHACFQCSHEHGHGDRCIAFHYDPGLVEHLAGGLHGIRTTSFREHRLPPLDELSPLIQAARHLASHPSRDAAEETAAGFASTALRLVNDAAEAPISLRDEKRVAASVALINQSFEEPLTLDLLAVESGISRFHFLRIFRRVMGVTPYGYLLNRRLAAAANMLATTDRQVLDVALACGFSDLSEFTRRFRARYGVPPLSFRRRTAIAG